MARVLAHHAGRVHWHAPSSHIWRNLSLAALWLVIISLGVVLVGSIIFTIVATLGRTPYFGASSSHPLRGDPREDCIHNAEVV